MSTSSLEREETESEKGTNEGNELPAGWAAKVDPKTGKTYYLNRQTKTTYWTLPSNLQSVVVETNEVKSEPQSSGADGAVSELPEGWEAQVDPGTHRTFYRNHKDKTTQWKHPLEGDKSDVEMKEEKAEPQEGFCPKEHKLLHMTTGYNGVYECNKCHLGNRCDAGLMRCEPCGYDICLTCHKKLPAQPLNFPPSLQSWKVDHQHGEVVWRVPMNVCLAGFFILGFLGSLAGLLYSVVIAIFGGMIAAAVFVGLTALILIQFKETKFIWSDRQRYLLQHTKMTFLNGWTRKKAWHYDDLRAKVFYQTSKGKINFKLEIKKDAQRYYGTPYKVIELRSISESDVVVFTKFFGSRMDMNLVKK